MSNVPPAKGTILLVSGELDRAMAAFEVAGAFQAMGMDMSLWFLLYGANCIRKPRSRFSPAKWFRKLRGGPGRVTKTDTALQYIIQGLNAEGANHLPLSQLNFGGLGPILLRKIMQKKQICSLEGMIQNAHDLGVRFYICQICVDSMALSPEDFLYPVEVKGASSYYLDASSSQYNVVI